MILVALGTQDKPFTRLLEMLEKEIDAGNIKDEVVVQAGYTHFNAKNMQMFDYIAKDEFEKLLAKCDVLITHGGVGSILYGIKSGKKVIAVPRLKKYHEHTNDHQVEIIDKFSAEGYILAADSAKKLSSALKSIKSFKPKNYKSNTSNIINFLEDYIDNL